MAVDSVGTSCALVKFKFFLCLVPGKVVIKIAFLGSGHEPCSLKSAYVYLFEPVCPVMPLCESCSPLY